MSSVDDRRTLVISEFKRIVKDGSDYTTRYMYQLAAKKAHISSQYAAILIRRYYKSFITNEMKIYTESIMNLKHEDVINKFAKRFKLCNRESRIIVRNIKCSK